MVRLLQRNNPFTKRKCGKEDCLICKEDGGGSCRETGTTYSIDCTGVPERDTLTTGDLGEQQQPTRTTAASETEGVTAKGCTSKGVYNGETGRNTYTRGVKHGEDYDKKVDGSAMWKHCVQHHNSERMRFRMQVKDRVRNDATKRQILEAVRIRRTEEGQRMNSRGEWGSNRIPRIEITRE